MTADYADLTADCADYTDYTDNTADRPLIIPLNTQIPLKIPLMITDCSDYTDFADK